jgi:3-vinyl bacteriochlorophyllide hydratase
MMTSGVVDRVISLVDCCPWQATIGSRPAHHPVHHVQMPAPRPLYTDAERARRDNTVWTLVQGVLAPAQFAVFLVSLYLVVGYLATGEGYALATGSVVVKTLVLYAIMVTGSIWERQVFGCYLFARPFFWEDVFSILVLALHTAYLVALFTGALGAQHLMVLALAAYAAYVVNAGQFVLKLRAARKGERRAAGPSGPTGAARVA